MVSFTNLLLGWTGLLTPLLYLTFDQLAPNLSARYPTTAEVLDNLVVFVMPVYVVFEVGWLATGTAWLASTDASQCSDVVVAFSAVVLANFWLHLLTPLLFGLAVCCSRVCCGCYEAVNSRIKKAREKWTTDKRLCLR